MMAAQEDGREKIPVKEHLGGALLKSGRFRICHLLCGRECCLGVN